MRFRTLVPFSDAEAAASDKLTDNRIFRQILAADAQEIVQELEQPLCLKNIPDRPSEYRKAAVPHRFLRRRARKLTQN